MTHIRLTLADYLVIVGYFVLVLWIGLWFRRRLMNTRDYFAGGNQIPWWMAGISHYMSSFSAFSFIVYAQIGYMYGWVSVTLFWMTVPACIAGGLFFAKRWRRARVVTPIQFLEARFNGLVQQLFAWAGIPMKVFDDALKVFATGIFVSVATGLDLPIAIVLCGVVMVAYTFFGGLWALIVTDYVQFLMKCLAILLMLPLAIVVAGGIHASFTRLPTHFLAPVNGPYGWIYILGFVSLTIVSYNASWSLAQKYYSVRDEHEATKAAYFSAFLNFLGAPLMILPAIIGRHILPNLVATHHTADTYVLLVMRLLPAGMVGIIIAAMFSATMATVSADFNAMASVLTQDIYRRLIRPSSPERHLLFMGRWITFGLGALTTVLSLWIAFAHQQSLFSLMVTVLGLFMAPTLLPLLAGLTVRGINWQGAFTGFVFGLATGCGMLAAEKWWPGASSVFGSGHNFEGVSLLANAALTIVGLALGTRLFPSTPAEKEQIDRFFVGMNTPVRAEEVPAKKENPAGPLLAFSTAGVGALLVVAGLISSSTEARVIDPLAGLFFVVIGAIFYIRSSKASVVEKSTSQR